MNLSKEQIQELIVLASQGAATIINDHNQRGELERVAVISQRSNDLLNVLKAELQPTPEKDEPYAESN